MVKEKNLSRAEIHAMRGRFKFNTGGKPFAEWMADWKRQEMELEEAKLTHLTRAGLFTSAANSNRSKRKLKSTG